MKNKRLLTVLHLTAWCLTLQQYSPVAVLQLICSTPLIRSKDPKVGEKACGRGGAEDLLGEVRIIFVLQYNADPIKVARKPDLLFLLEGLAIGQVLLLVALFQLLHDAGHLQGLIMILSAVCVT